MLAPAQVVCHGDYSYITGQRVAVIFITVYMINSTIELQPFWLLCHVSLYMTSFCMHAMGI